jgi:hypothetical protein
LATHEEPPKIHNLVQLANLSGLSLSEYEIDFLGRINEFNITGRYNIPLAKLPDVEDAAQLYYQAKEMFAWLSLKY